MKIKFLFLSIFIILILLNFYNLSYAQSGIQPPDILKKGGGSFIPKDQKAPIKTSDDIIDLIRGILEIMSVVFWILAVGGALYAAYLYLFSRGSEEKTKEAKKMLLYVVIAIAIALMASALPTLIYNFLGRDFQGNTPQYPPENSLPPTIEV
jgi:hypothetical protein